MNSQDVESPKPTKPAVAMEAPSPEISGEDKEGLINLSNFAKKKKKKSPKLIPGVEDPPAADGEFNPSLLKKKKKKKPSSSDTSNPSSFDAQLSKAGVSQSTDAAKEPDEYQLLLSRFFTLLHSDHPELAEGGKKVNKKIPAPSLFMEPKKTIFANCKDICTFLNRTDEHVAQYIFAELGTTGNFDGSRRLVIKGKFRQMQLETVIKRYLGEYVHCKTCKTLDTDLKKGENRLFFLTCNVCESRRSVRYVYVHLSMQLWWRNN